MRIDRHNLYAGKVLFFWGVGKPIVDRGKMWFGFAKVGKWGNPGAMVESQGCFIRSDNILTERDPRKIRFTLLPNGDEGLRAPQGPVSDEANPVALSDGSLYATYRTVDGYNCHAYSRDGGHTWTPSAYADLHALRPQDQAPARSQLREEVFQWQVPALVPQLRGRGGPYGKWDYYSGRNPAWVCGGVEKDGYIHWSEPEILLYDEKPDTRMSYPDFVEDGGRFFVTETQKTIARVHEIHRSLLDGLWDAAAKPHADHEWVYPRDVNGTGEHDMPIILPSLTEGGGFTLDFRIRLRELSAGQTIFDTRDGSGRGIAITTTDRSTFRSIRERRPHQGRVGLGSGTIWHPTCRRVATRHRYCGRRPAHHHVDRGWCAQRRRRGARIWLGPLSRAICET